MPPELSLSVSQDPKVQGIDMSLVHVDRIDAGTVDFWAEAIDNVQQVINHGAFSGRFLSPTESHIELVTVNETTPNTLQFGLEVAAVDPGAWRVLLNLVYALSQVSIRLSRCAIHASDDTPGNRLDERSTLQLPYPTHHVTLPFRVEHTIPPDPTKDRLVQLEFREPPPDERVQECVRTLLAWDNMLLGGYPEAGQPPESNATDATEAYLISPVTVEHPLPNYLGSESAFDAVVAIAHWFELTGTPVSAVRIE